MANKEFISVKTSTQKAKETGPLSLPLVCITGKSTYTITPHVSIWLTR